MALVFPLCKLFGNGKNSITCEGICYGFVCYSIIMCHITLLSCNIFVVFFKTQTQETFWNTSLINVQITSDTESSETT